MTQKRTQASAAIIAAARRERALRETTYRERALKLFPHVCARCGREFSGDQRIAQDREDAGVRHAGWPRSPWPSAARTRPCSFARASAKRSW